MISLATGILSTISHLPPSTIVRFLCVHHLSVSLRLLNVRGLPGIRQVTSASKGRKDHLLRRFGPCKGGSKKNFAHRVGFFFKASVGGTN